MKYTEEDVKKATKNLAELWNQDPSTQATSILDNSSSGLFLSISSESKDSYSKHEPKERKGVTKCLIPTY